MMDGFQLMECYDLIGPKTDQLLEPRCFRWGD